MSTLNQSGSTITGAYSQTAGSGDSYTLVETGSCPIAGGGGVFNYTQTLTATDTSTPIETGNELTGQFQRTVTGATNGSVVEAGTSNGAPFSFGAANSTSFAISETGNYVDGSLSLSETGSDRYHLIQQFNNPSNAAGGTGSGGNGPGNVDYSPVGAPLTIGQAPAAPTGGGAYPGEQSPAAAQQDPFAQQGLDLLHEYCFAAGTLVLTNAGPKPIEQTQPGDLILSVDDKNPDGPAEWKPVEQVYHNAPAELLNVHLSTSRLPSGTASETGSRATFPPFGRGGQGGSLGMHNAFNSPIGSLSTSRMPGGTAGETGSTTAEVLSGSQNLLDDIGPSAYTPDQILRPTFNHPFHAAGKGWTSAANLEIGDRLRTPDGDTVTVTDLFANGDVEPVYNLRVAGNHTYFVGGDARDFVLVHNTSPAPVVQLDLNTGAVRSLNLAVSPRAQAGGTIQAVPDQYENTGAPTARDYASKELIPYLTDKPQQGIAGADGLRLKQAGAMVNQSTQNERLPAYTMDVGDRRMLLVPKDWGYVSPGDSPLTFSPRALAELHVHDPQEMRNLQSLETGLGVPLHMLPGGAAADYFAQEGITSKDAWVSAAGDGAMLLTAGGSKALRITGMALEGGVMTVRGVEMTQDIATGKYSEAAQKGAEVVLRGLSIKGAMKGFSELPSGLPAPRGVPHGNSLEYVGDTHVYAITGPDGPYKIGESMQGVRVGDGASIRGEAQARQLLKETGDFYKSDIRRTFPDKASAREYETRYIDTFRRIFGDDALPGNKTNR